MGEYITGEEAVAGVFACSEAKDGSSVLCHYNVKGSHWGDWNEETRRRRMREAGLIPTGNAKKDKEIYEKYLVKTELKEFKLEDLFKGMRWGSGDEKTKVAEKEARKESRSEAANRIVDYLSKSGSVSSKLTDEEKEERDRIFNDIKSNSKASSTEKVLAAFYANHTIKKTKKEERENDRRQAQLDAIEQRQAKEAPFKEAEAEGKARAAQLDASGFKTWDEFNDARIKALFGRDAKSIREGIGTLTTEELRNKTAHIQAEQSLNDALDKIPPKGVEKLKRNLKTNAKSFAGAAVKTVVEQGILGRGLVRAGVKPQTATAAQIFIAGTLKSMGKLGPKVPNPPSNTYPDELIALQEEIRRRQQGE